MKTIATITYRAFAIVAFAFSGLLPMAYAITPAPDGGYPGGNTAEGQNALLNLTTGGFNTGVGFLSLRSNTTGQFNTAIGAGALLANIADQNTATGSGALLSNTSGSQNTANGAFALSSNTTGEFNTAVGQGSLFSSTIGGGDTAIGYQALFSSTVGSGNTAIGSDALLNNTTGGDNIALGDSAGSLLTTGDNNIDIGNNGVAGEANTIRIGDEIVQTATYIAGINGQTASGGVAVFVKADGKLGTVTSSARFKDDIKPMDQASEALLALKPVTFRYKKEIDPKGIPQFGLVAEEVEKVNPDLVVRDANGKPQTVRYEQVNAMLLNEFLKEHCKVEKLEATVADLAAQLQKISAQVKVNTPAMRVAAENR